MMRPRSLPAWVTMQHLKDTAAALSLDLIIAHDLDRGQGKGKRDVKKKRDGNSRCYPHET